jgi:hypothetical protein
LRSDRIVELEALPGWKWDPVEALFQRGLAALRQYVNREGDARVPQRHVEPFDGQTFNLGAWASNRRAAFKRGQLSPDSVAALEALPGWEW